jgi:hypothetical protein
MNLLHRITLFFERRRLKRRMRETEALNDALDLAVATAVFRHAGDKEKMKAAALENLARLGHTADIEDVQIGDGILANNVRPLNPRRGNG